MIEIKEIRSYEREINRACNCLRDMKLGFVKERGWKIVKDNIDCDSYEKGSQVYFCLNSLVNDIEKGEA